MNARPLVPSGHDKHLFRLDGRVALVTGASGWLGAAMAGGLAAAGAWVFAGGRNLEKLETVVRNLRALGHRVDPLAFDVTDDTACAEAISRVERDAARLDVVVNNAYTGQAGTIVTTSMEDFDRACRTTLSAPFAIVGHALPLLKDAGGRNPGGASIINIASMYGVVSPDPRIYGTSGSDNPPCYGAAKAGLIQLTRYFACHLAQWNIRANSISPGPFPRAELAQRQPAFHHELCSKAPLGRVGSPPELVGPVVFLASDASSYVTGIDLLVDGGWTAW
jgi:NAD(P)-dependent dehydrogenase (short-subunit alcohol dehydrogenase family)